MDGKQEMRNQMLKQELEEIKLIEKMVAQVKEIAQKTSAMIMEQGVQLKIAATSIKSAKQKFQEGKTNLV